jgi:hypothetical protein
MAKTSYHTSTVVLFGCPDGNAHVFSSTGVNHSAWMYLCVLVQIELQGMPVIPEVPEEDSLYGSPGPGRDASPAKQAETSPVKGPPAGEDVHGELAANGEAPVPESNGTDPKAAKAGKSQENKLD